MNESLKLKITNIITEETGYGLDVSAELTAKIAAIVDGEQSVSTTKLEKLASAQHDIWAYWMRYVFSFCANGEHGEKIIPSYIAKRWEKQLDTPYDCLSEREKETDKEIVKSYLPSELNKETIAISEAVKRLIEWARLLLTCHVYPDGAWRYELSEEGILSIPAWLEVIADGKYTPAAVEEGLRDLFVSKLGAKDDNDNHEPEN